MRTLHVKGKWISRIHKRIQSEFLPGCRGGGFTSRLGKGHKTHGGKDAIDYHFLDLPGKNGKAAR